MKEIYKYILGYFFGISLFVVFIPWCLYKLSWLDESVFGITLFGSDLFRIIVFIPFFIIGIVFMVWSNIYLFVVGKGGPAEGFGVDISPKTKKLVTSGPYKYSRNPMVFGAFSLYISIGFFLNSLICILVLTAFSIIATLYLCFSEEKRLIKDFGEEYINYRKKVPMIFPFFNIK